MGGLHFPVPTLRGQGQGRASAQFFTSAEQVNLGREKLKKLQFPGLPGAGFAHGSQDRREVGRLQQQMAGKPCGAAPPYPHPGDRRWLRRGLGLLSPLWERKLPGTPPVGPPAGLGARGQLEFRSGSWTGQVPGRGSSASGEGVARAVCAAGFRGLCGARSFPGSESPQVASGRGGEPLL